MRAPGERAGLHPLFLLAPVQDALGALPPRASRGTAAAFVKESAALGTEGAARAVLRGTPGLRKRAGD